MADEKNPEHLSEHQGPSQPGGSTSHNPEDPYGFGHDPYAYEQHTPPAELAAATVPELPPAKPNPVVTPSRRPPSIPPMPPTSPKEENEDPDEEGMARMSFLEHLEELRTRIIRALIGFAVVFVACLFFAPEIWKVISEPAIVALKHMGAKSEGLISTQPMEQFNVIWIKAPMVVSIFLGSPIIIYQIWAFIAPGLYKRERRWAVPFIVCTSGLFITGGFFAYFVVFRFGLEFLLGIGKDVGVQPFITVSEYFDLFVDVMLGVGAVFELPVMIFFLTLIRVVSPKFLIEHSRYAILGIVILAAVITPTPDVFNLMLFAVPMILLYFVGVFAAYLLVLHREGKKFPWKYMILSLLGVIALGGLGVWIAIAKYGYHFVNHPPYLVK